MTSAPIDAALLPDTARVLDDDVEVGGVSLRELAADATAPRCSSTTRRRCARAAARRPLPSTTAWPSRPSRSSAARWRAWPSRRGSASTSRPGASSTWCCARACPRAGSSCTATTSRAEELERAVAVGRAPPGRGQLRRDRPTARAGVGRVAPLRLPGPRDARASRPTPTNSCAPAKRTRSSASPSRRATRARRSTSCARSRALTLHGVHAHIGSQIFDARGLRRVARDPGRLHRRRRLRRALRRRRTRRGLRRGRESAPSIAQWGDAVRDAARAAGLDAERAIYSPNRVAPSSPRRRSRSTRWARSSRVAAAHLHGGRRRHERQPAAGPLRLGLRGLRRRPTRSRRARRACASWASTARAATS